MKRINQQTKNRSLKRNSKKLKTKENMKKVISEKKTNNKLIRLLTGFLLIPLMFALYFIDRAIYSINPFVTHYRFKDWKIGTERIKASIIRFIGLLIIVSILTAFKLIMKFFFS